MPARRTRAAAQQAADAAAVLSDASELPAQSSKRRKPQVADKSKAPAASAETADASAAEPAPLTHPESAAARAVRTRGQRRAAPAEAAVDAVGSDSPPGKTAAEHEAGAAMPTRKAASKHKAAASAAHRAQAMSAEADASDVSRPAQDVSAAQQPGSPGTSRASGRSRWTATQTAASGAMAGSAVRVTRQSQKGAGLPEKDMQKQSETAEEVSAALGSDKQSGGELQTRCVAAAARTKRGRGK